MVECKCRDFLWGSHDQRRRIPLVGWDKICTKKKYGGLNIKSCRDWNVAAIGKQVWDLARKKDSLWVKWINGVYLKGKDIWNYDPPQDCSWVWKKIDKVKRKIAGQVQNNRWQLTKDGEYTLQSCYDWLRGDRDRLMEDKVIWNRFNVPKHSYIGWLTVLQKLQTRDRISRYITIHVSDCLLCGEEEESIPHLFFKCKWSKQLLERICSWLNGGHCPVLYHRWKRWIRFVHSRWKYKQKVVIAGIMGVVYKVWEERNTRYFTQKERSPEAVFAQLRVEIQLRISNLPVKKMTDRDHRFLKSIQRIQRNENVED